MSSSSSSAYLYVSAYVGVFNLVFTLVATWIVAGLPEYQPAFVPDALHLVALSSTMAVATSARGDPTGLTFLGSIVASLASLVVCFYAAVALLDHNEKIENVYSGTIALSPDLSRVSSFSYVAVGTHRARAATTLISALTDVFSVCWGICLFFVLRCHGYDMLSAYQRGGGKYFTCVGVRCRPVDECYCDCGNGDRTKLTVLGILTNVFRVFLAFVLSIDFVAVFLSIHWRTPSWAGLDAPNLAVFSGLLLHALPFDDAHETIRLRTCCAGGRRRRARTISVRWYSAWFLLFFGSIISTFNVVQNFSKERETPSCATWESANGGKPCHWNTAFYRSLFNVTTGRSVDLGGFYYTFDSDPSYAFATLTSMTRASDFFATTAGIVVLVYQTVLSILVNCRRRRDDDGERT